MAVELSPHLGVFLAAVIVEDDMDDFAGRDLGLDRIEKTDEFLVPVAPHAAADHPAFEYIEGGKTERGAAVALVVISYRPATTRFQRQAGLRAIEPTGSAISHRLSTIACTGGST